MGVVISGLPAVAMAYVAEEMHPKSLGLATGYRLIAAPLSLSQTAMGLIFSVYLFGVVSSTWAAKGA